MAPAHPVILRLVNAAAFFGAIAMNYFSKDAFNEGKNNDHNETTFAVSPNVTSPSSGVWIVPARYAFGIWGLIYMFLLGFVVFQLLPWTLKKTSVGAFANTFVLIQERISYFFVASCFLNAFWLYVYGSGYQVLSFFVIFLLLASVGVIWYRLHPFSRNLAYGVLAADQRDGEAAPLIGQEEQSNRQASRDPFLVSLLVRLPFSLYFGWMICATTVSLFAVFIPINPENPSSTIPSSIAALILLSLLSLGLLAKFQDLAVALVAVWALTSIPNNGAIEKYPGSDAEIIANTAKGLAAVVGFACALLAVLRVAALSRKFLAA